MINILKRIFFRLILILLFLYLTLFIHNNYWSENYSQTDIENAYSNSITWLITNEEKIFKEKNSMLWWLLIQSLELENEPRLKKLVDNYLNENYLFYVNTPWHSLLYDGSSKIDSLSLLASKIPEYSKYFVYGYTCDVELKNSETIRKQNNLNYCFINYPTSPTCFTHQLMAFRFMQRANCKTDIKLETHIEKIANWISYQLTFDVRVVDVYIQRVMMLIDSGNSSKLRKRWVKRILIEQLNDGGWSGFQPLLSIGNNKFIGFGSRGLAMKSNNSNFHATAQGLYLLSMLKNKYYE